MWYPIIITFIAIGLWIRLWHLRKRIKKIKEKNDNFTDQLLAQLAEERRNLRYAHERYDTLKANTVGKDEYWRIREECLLLQQHISMHLENI